MTGKENNLRKRHPLRYALLLIAALILGLLSRKFSHVLPWWMAKNAGDVLCRH